VDGKNIIYPDQIYRINKIKSKAVKYTVGGIVSATGLSLLVYASLGTILFDNIPIVVFTGTGLVIAGITTLVLRVETYNISNGDKILFIQDNK